MSLPARAEPRARPRVGLALLALTTIALGLATRAVPQWFPPVVATYGGDALWATLVYWLIGFVRPRVTVPAAGAAALAIAFLVETSQLITTPWLVAIRRTTAGALVLGQGFLWSDLVSYAVGVAMAMAIDAAWSRTRRPR
ncbi:MAG: DUF2809 domain-containing protein [Gemmatimonadales bacterium]|nr:DUF2809 domain-containing protein [Gemmatimonadales bacterium]